MRRVWTPQVEPWTSQDMNPSRLVVKGASAAMALRLLPATAGRESSYSTRPRTSPAFALDLSSTTAGRPTMAPCAARARLPSVVDFNGRPVSETRIFRTAAKTQSVISSATLTGRTDEESRARRAIDTHSRHRLHCTNSWPRLSLNTIARVVSYGQGPRVQSSDSRCPDDVQNLAQP